ncbi:MAG: outer membrane beta-barrel protein [Bdellovibrionaceae bacterium]|nr:outer membrane beta-barrel protein [Pseudobdellovibrionaceae bacterium]MBX3034528.1 outer membrane beta-barrel protein [Pseudobdellovibrionaceae bacterium]
MKHLLLSALLVGSVFTVQAAHADDFGLEVGFRQQSGTLDATGVTAKSQSGYQLGVSGFFPFQGNLGLRSGFFYVNRPLAVDVDAGGGDAKISLTYFEVPLALAYKFEDYASVFGGVALSINLDKTYDGNGILKGQKVDDVKSPVLPLILGASFKFAPQMGTSVFFESFGGEAAKGLKDFKAVGANLVIYFE